MGEIANFCPVILGETVNRLGTWNVRRIKGMAKREEVVDIFSKGKFDRLALPETKLKGNGENHGVE